MNLVDKLKKKSGYHELFFIFPLFNVINETAKVKPKKGTKIIIKEIKYKTKQYLVISIIGRQYLTCN